MAITDPNSVLILGAGTSAPFGLPLGGDLIDQIAKAIASERTFLHPKDDFHGGAVRQNYSWAARDDDTFFKAPIHAAVTRQFLLSGGDFAWDKVEEQRKALATLGERLANQTSETIDDFIVENAALAPVTKIAVAALILKQCYHLRDDSGMKSWRPQSFSFRHYGSIKTRNWIHLLINIIRHGIRTKLVTPDNKIQIITFNYDRVLEHVLEAQFSNTEAKHPHYSNFINILHVHGAFEDLTDTPREFASMTLRWASGLHVVNEPNVPEEIANVRASAKSLVANADEIFCMGFSFAGPNCRLLGLDSIKIPSAGKKRLYFCNYDGNVGVKRSAEKLGEGSPKKIIVEEAAGTSERPLGASDWLKAGHLGELPG